MDLWVVAAAAGVGYLAKHLQNLPSSEKERLVESSLKFSTHTSQESRNLLQQVRDKTCPLRRLSQERASQQKDGFDRRIVDMEQLVSTTGDSHSGSRMASTTGRSDGNVASNVVREDYNVLWLSSTPLGFTGRESVLQNMEFVDAGCSPFEFGKFKSLKNRPSGYFVKPLSSLQSCLSAPLYKERDKMDVYGSLPSPCIPTMRPVLITEGTEIISRSDGIPLGIWSNSSEDTLKSDACWNEKNAPSDPSLDTNLVDLHGWTSGTPKRLSGKPSQLPGSPNLMFLFMIGITIGIISTIIANENEVTRLNEQLKQANNLVQDLLEELEMKDKLTVRDLADEDSQPLNMRNPYLSNQDLIPSVPRPNQPEASEIESYGTKMASAKTAEDPMLRSEIETELEAELERLELNMKTSVLDRTSRFTELDLEFEADTIQEEMKLDLPSRQYNNDSSERDHDGESETATDHTLPPNYAVSPRELTICLHELIESRLEGRIKELETALQNSQNRLRFLGSECITSQDSTSAT